jgi:hypothetical protein
MTIAFGFNCINGLVLATDSLETDGVTKRNVNKMWAHEVSEDWGIAIASAGESDLADSFNDDLKEILGNSDFDEVRLFLKLRNAIKGVRRAYPDAQFAFLAAIYSRPNLYCRLFRVNDESLHLGPVKRYQSLGVGGSLASFLASQLFRMSMNVAEGVRLAAFILAIVKEHADGCGGPTSIVSYTKYEEYFKVWGKEEITAIENELPAGNFKKALKKFWKENNPAPAFDIDTEPPEGGRVNLIRSGRLNTIP